ncbi:MAG: M24 family metallopeptidase [Thermodesulfovibrionales bacterium]
MIPNEQGTRIQRLQAKLGESGLDGALIIYPVDIYYFCGTRQNSLLWVPADGSPVLLVKKSLSRASAESSVTDVRPLPSSRDFPAFFGREIKRIGLMFDVLPVQHYTYYAGLLEGRELFDISPLNRELRAIKSAWELEQMRISGSRLSGIFSEVPSFLRPGMRELDLAAEFEYRLKKAGSEGYVRIRAFNQEIIGLAVSGENAAIPGCFDGPVTGKGLSAAAPYGPSNDLILNNVPIMIDYAAIFNGYIVDMTRIFSFGSLAPELQNAFDTARSIQAWLVENLRPGSTGEDLYRGAAAIAESAGLGGHFMGYPGEQAKFVGHGVGLELDELPVLAPKFRAPLQPGNTLAIEPKFVFPGRGVVGIENTYAVKADGCELLTPCSDEILYL